MTCFPIKLDINVCYQFLQLWKLETAWLKQIMFWYKIFLHFRFAKILHSQLSLTKDGKCLLISWKTSHFCSEKKLIGPKKIAETFTFCEKEIAKLYTATSSRLNTSLYLEFNWNILKEKLNSFNLNSTFGRDEAL